MRRIQWFIAAIAGIAMVAGCADDAAPPTMPETPQGRIAGKFIVLSVPSEINGKPSSGAFTHLIGKQITVEITFDALEEVRRDREHPKKIEYATGPVKVTLAGDSYLAEEIAPLFEGQRFGLTVSDESILIDFYGSVHGATASEQYSLWVTAPLLAALDDDGYPVLRDFDYEVGEIGISRLDENGTRLTDQASGDAAVSFRAR